MCYTGGGFSAPRCISCAIARVFKAFAFKRCDIALNHLLNDCVLVRARICVFD